MLAVFGLTMLSGPALADSDSNAPKMTPQEAQCKAWVDALESGLQVGATPGQEHKFSGLSVADIRQIAQTSGYCAAKDTAMQAKVNHDSGSQ